MLSQNSKDSGHLRKLLRPRCWKSSYWKALDGKQWKAFDRKPLELFTFGAHGSCSRTKSTQIAEPLMIAFWLEECGERQS